MIVKFAILLLLALSNTRANEFRTVPIAEIERKKEVGRFASFRRAPDLPADDGLDNFGDLWLGERVSGDEELLSQIEINELSDMEQDMAWEAEFPNTTLSHVRILNMGRQRGYVDEIGTSGEGFAFFLIKVRPFHQFRILIEVFGNATIPGQ